MEEQLIKLTDYVIGELFHKNISNAAALFHPEILYEEGSKERQLRGSTRVSQELEKSPTLELEIAFSQEISRELYEKVLESIHLQSEQERKLIVGGKNGTHYLIRRKEWGISTGSWKRKEA